MRLVRATTRKATWFFYMKNLPKDTKPLKDYEGYYASKDGFIYSCKTNSGRITDNFRKLKGNVLNHYIQVILSYGKQRYVKTVHRLVYEAFNGVIPDGLQVNHLDGIKHNNSLDNLELTDAFGNMQHASRNGLFACQKGSNNNHSKLKEMDVIGMRAAWETGLYTLNELAKLYDVHNHSVRRIVYRKTWQHI